MSDDTDDPKTAPPERHEHRVVTLSAPYGRLSPTGTLLQTPSGGTPRLSDHPEGRIPAVAGRRRAAEGGVAATASAGEGLEPDGEAFTCEAVLAADGAPPANALPFEATAGERRLKGALAARI
ncbi:hypothetical protein [Streptomyces sp. NPDC097981]|uniref:hypothetical protein n=1 Tax=Streptomyces sp. NPDC097981 TaxID=3155428 RepID=UPI003322DDE3